MSELDDQFKEFINEAIDISFNNNIEMKIFLKEWLQGMYSQAAKADEYEAKAKAWDKYKAHMESYIAGEVNEEELVSDLTSDYFESGEYDAKK